MPSTLRAGKDGFLAINENMQSAGGPAEVFACGDVATSVLHPRPKAGVFAVRQGAPLAANLRRFLSGEALVPFVPQTSFLGLISMGGKHAVAVRGSLAFSTNWLWTLKDSIDRGFIRGFGDDLPRMNSSVGVATHTKKKQAV
jgi:selenide, water dikinase